jgi:hypothetical protein
MIEAKENEMKRISVVGLGFLLVASVLAWKSNAQTQRNASKRTTERAWLEQFVGQWDSEAEVFLEPGKAPFTWKGSETTRSIDPHWVIAESVVTFMDQPMTGVRTFGYDRLKNKYVGTFVGSFSDHLWVYEGALDASGKVLTLEANGPAPYAPGTLCKWRDVIEFTGEDRRVLTNSLQNADGTWQVVVKAEFRRKH